MLDGVTVVTDPILRRRVEVLHSVGFRPSAEEVAATDVVLLSHLHHDHTDLPSLRRFGPGSTVVVPRGGGAWLRSRVQAAVVELAVGQSLAVGGLVVEASWAEHPAGRRGGPAAPAVGYLVRGSRTVYFAGDTHRYDGMRALGDRGLDLALVPIGGWGLTRGEGHLDPSGAADAVQLLRPRYVVPIHWRTLRIPMVWRLRPDRFVTAGQRFASAVRRVAPATQVLLPEPGEWLWTTG